MNMYGTALSEVIIHTCIRRALLNINKRWEGGEYRLLDTILVYDIKIIFNCQRTKLALYWAHLSTIFISFGIKKTLGDSRFQNHKSSVIRFGFSVINSNQNT